MGYNYLTYDDVLDSETMTTTIKEPLYPKFQAMFWIFAEALLVAVLALRCIEKGNKVSKILAMIGLGFGAVSILLQLLLIWGAFSFMELTSSYGMGFSMMGKITMLTTITMVVAIVGALVMRIKSNEAIVGLLKSVAMFSGIGIWAITSIMIFSENYGVYYKILNLEGVLLACFMVGWVTALVLSKIAHNDYSNVIVSSEEIKEDTGSQKGIEEQIEKEVQARLEAEKDRLKRDAMPPLQDENLAPTVGRDSELKIDMPNDLNNS